MTEDIEPITLIISGSFLLIGFILFILGSKYNIRYIKLIGVSLSTGAAILLFVRSAELRSILTAIAAVLAVIISAKSIDESSKLRKDSYDRESRERIDKELNNILIWLKETSSNIFSYNRTDFIDQVLTDAKLTIDIGLKQEVIDILRDADRGLNTISNLSQANRESSFYKAIAYSIDNSLGELISQLEKAINKRRYLILENAKEPKEKYPKYPKEVTQEMLDELQKRIEELRVTPTPLGENAATIQQKINDCIEKVISLKSNLININIS